jgi:hypothetical protein
MCRGRRRGHAERHGQHPNQDQELPDEPDHPWLI